MHNLMGHTLLMSALAHTALPETSDVQQLRYPVVRTELVPHICAIARKILGLLEDDPVAQRGLILRHSNLDETALQFAVRNQFHACELTAILLEPFQYHSAARVKLILTHAHGHGTVMHDTVSHPTHSAELVAILLQALEHKGATRREFLAIPNYSNRTALQLAKKLGNRAVVRMLKNAQADEGSDSSEEAASEILDSRACVIS